MDALLPPAFAFFLVLLRTAGLCAVAPLFGAKGVPARVRMGVAGALAVALYAGGGVAQLPVPGDVLALAGHALAETLVGLAGGLSARMLLEAASAAGHLGSTGMGLGYGALVDPFSGAESTAVSQLFSVAALGVAVALGIHREAVAWLAASVRAMPPGAVSDLPQLFQGAVAQALFTTALAVRLAFPLLAASTVGHFALGLLGRAAPQLNLQSVGFSVSLFAGGGALFLLAPTIAELAARTALSAFTSR